MPVMGAALAIARLADLLPVGQLNTVEVIPHKITRCADVSVY